MAFSGLPGSNVAVPSVQEAGASPADGISAGRAPAVVAAAKESQQQERPENRLAPFNPTSEEVQLNIIGAMGLASGDVLFDLGCGDGRLLVTAAKMVKGLRCVGIEYDDKFVTRAVASVVAAAAADEGNDEKAFDLKDRVDIRHGDLLEALQLDAVGGGPSPSSFSAAGAAPDATSSKNCSSSGDTIGASCRDLTVMDATCVYVYLLPKGIEKIKPMLDDIVSRKKKNQSKNQQGAAGEVSRFRVVTYLFQIKGWAPTSVDRSSKSSSPLYLYEFF